MILVRHGQSEFNVVYGETRQDPGIRDPQLTELGHRQAGAIKDTVAALNITRILCSPYRRTLQTAEILTEALGLPIEVDPLIGERAYFTCDIGSHPSHLRDRWPDIDFDHLDHEWWPALDETEELLDVRCQTFRQNCLDADNWQNTLVVSHWGFIRGLTGLRVENCGILRFDPTAPHPGGGIVVSTPELC